MFSFDHFLSFKNYNTKYSRIPQLRPPLLRPNEIPSFPFSFLNCYFIPSMKAIRQLGSYFWVPSVALIEGFYCTTTTLTNTSPDHPPPPPTGTTFLQQFCTSAVNAVVSPFILYDLAMAAARCLARNNPTHVPTQLRSNILNSLFQKCLQM